MEEPTPEVASSARCPSATGGHWAQMVDGLRPVHDLTGIVESVLVGLGLSEVAFSPELSAAPPRVDLSVLHFIILPQQSTWLDFQFEADRDSAGAIFTTMTGESAGDDAELEDVLRETMNLIHGGLKSAFKQDGIDVIVPAVPQSIETARLAAAAGGAIVQHRMVFTAAGNINLRLTLGARPSPITYKFLRQLRLAQVLVDPLTLDASPGMIVVKPHTMLSERMVEKIHHMAECESAMTTHAVIEPSPLAELLSRR